MDCLTFSLAHRIELFPRNLETFHCWHACPWVSMRSLVRRLDLVALTIAKETYSQSDLLFLRNRAKRVCQAKVITQFVSTKYIAHWRLGMDVWFDSCGRIWATETDASGSRWSQLYLLYLLQILIEWWNDWLMKFYIQNLSMLWAAKLFVDKYGERRIWSEWHPCLSMDGNYCSKEMEKYFTIDGDSDS